VHRHGKWLTLSPKDVDRAQQWFQRHGASAVLLGRLVPGVRTFVSLPAGFTAMGVAPFLFYSALGTVLWTAALAYAGVILKSNFALVGDYINVATNAVLGVLALMLVRRYVNCWRESRDSGS
jgi:membrane protein DedA with SNARE-associated domain